MLSMQTTITDMDIADVAVLRTGTVYLLSGHANEKLVVKVESGNVDKQMLKHNRLAMRAVDPKAGGNAKPLKKAEVDALKDWAEFMKRVTSDFADNKIDNFGSGAAAKDLASCLEMFATNLWYKMPAADLTGADKLLEARLGAGGNAPDKGIMKQFADGLNADGGLEQLGRIVAADMYIGNQDRFNPTNGSQKDFGGKQLKFKVLMNPGNLFMVGKKTQQRISVSGHDFIDPNSGFRYYDRNIDDISRDYNQAWLGETLCHSSSRKKFADHIVHDLEVILTPNRKSYSPFRKLESNAAKRIERGMKDGMKLIVKAIDDKHGRGQMPQGVKQRRDRFEAALR
jgi:hypothetical protein